MVRIIVGTQSAIKLDAVRCAWNDVNDIVVEGIQVKSSVSNQPASVAEGLAGATHRMRCAMREPMALPEAGTTICIGIENFIYEHGLGYVDQAVIVASVRWNKHHIAPVTVYSKAVDLPRAFVPPRSGTTTWGDWLHDIDATVNPQDPHKHVCGISRRDIIFFALQSVRRELEHQMFPINMGVLGEVPVEAPPSSELAGGAGAGAGAGAEASEVDEVDETLVQFAAKPLAPSVPPASATVDTATAPMDPSLLTVVPDFPKKGINFVNVDKLLHQPKLLNDVIDRMAQHAMKMHCTGIVMLGARGFLFGPAVALRIGKPCAMIRKAGKLPGETVASEDFKIEYRATGNVVEMDARVFGPGDRLIILDDLVATGGTVKAARSLIEKVGATVVGTLALFQIPRPEGVDTWGDDLTDCRFVFRHEAESKGVEGCLYDDVDTVLMCHTDLEYMVASRRGYVPMQWDTFPDGSPNLHFNADVLDGRHVVFFLSCDRMTTVLEQLQVVRILGRQKGVLSVTIVIPYLSVGTMERVDAEGTVATAETTLRMLTKGMTSSVWAKTRILIGDPHAKVTRFFISDDASPQMINLFETDEFLAHIPADGIVVYPDEGARKRFMASKHYKHRPTITCIKRRMGAQRRVEISGYDNLDVESHDMSTRTFVLVDDLVRSGGTLLACIEALKTKFGSGITVQVSVTHLAFDHGKERLFLAGGEVNKFVGFNTVARSQALTMHPFVLLDATPHFLAAAPRFVMHRR